MTARASSDRRRRTRDTPDGGPTRAQLVLLIAGMYRDLPGLNLSLRQAARLFGVPAATCQVVFEDLVKTGQLRKTADGKYSGSDHRHERPATLRSSAT